MSLKIDDSDLSVFNTDDTRLSDFENIEFSSICDYKNKSPLEQMQYKVFHREFKTFIDSWCMQARVKTPIGYSFAISTHPIFYSTTSIGYRVVNNKPSLYIYTSEIDKMSGKNNKLYKKYSSLIKDYVNNITHTECIIHLISINRFLNINIYEEYDFD